MQKPAVAESSRSHPVGILSVSPHADDHAILRSIFENPACSDAADCGWKVFSIARLAEAAEVLGREIAIVLCECELRPGTWRDLLDHIWILPDPPLVIVTTRRLSDSLWSEAQALGIYDVLAKPFETAEVDRTVNWAWQRRQAQRARKYPTKSRAAMTSPR